MLLMLIFNYILSSKEPDTTVCDCSDNFQAIGPTKETTTVKTTPPVVKTTPPVVKTTHHVVKKTTTEDPKFSNNISNNPLNFSNWMRSDITTYDTQPKAWNDNFSKANQ